jgi:DNA-binding NarL/FixJ family response regulator
MAAYEPIRVLVVDDDESMRAVTRAFVQLVDSMIVVAEASDGEAAIELAELLEPDAVLLDHSMPVMTGLAALPRLRTLLPNATIVMQSADAALAEQAMSGGADAFMFKGADPLTTVVRALATPHVSTLAAREGEG